MLDQAVAVTGVAVLGLAGLAASNVLYDRGVPSAASRYVAPVIGGGGFLAAVSWLDVWIAVALSSAMTAGILGLRLRSRGRLRGVHGSLPTQAWSEVTYAIAGTASLAIGWGLLDDRWLAFVPIAFMAWGDSAAGLARATLLRGRPGSIWASVAMLAVCLVVALLYEPYWTGALGAAVATAAERRRPMLLTVWDDNAHVVAMSLTAMALLASIGR